MRIPADRLRPLTKLRMASSIVESRRACARLVADPIQYDVELTHSLGEQIIRAVVDAATMKFRRITNL
jgi:hypothetical protein